jgi:hypothetical protein
MLMYVRTIASRGRVAVALGAIALATVATPLAGDAASNPTVRTRGDYRMVPNALFQSTLRFQPGHVSATSGSTLTLQHDDKTQDPHTLTIANEDELPDNIEEMFACGEPGTICGDTFDSIPGEPETSAFFNAVGTSPGIDGRLDSLFVLPGESASAVIDAPPGSTLYFVCVIHAWMQGEIRVR